MSFEEFIEEWKDSRNYIEAKTSGSTGVPKIIRLEKEFIKESALRTIEFFGITEGDRLHSCVGADFIGGKMMAVRALIAGSFFTWETPSNQALKNIEKTEEIDLLAVVPSQMVYILDNLNRLPKIKNVIIGGGAISPQLRQKIYDSGLNAYETYGMTETASHIALRKITEEEIPFRCFDDISIKLGRTGCLEILYQSGNIISTNDLVEVINEKEFYILGRKDNIIISGGKKINPVEIESKLANYLLKDFILVGLPDKLWGEKLVLIIEGNEGDVDIDAIRDNLGKEIERWQLPKEIKFIEKLPRTPNGKIARGLVYRTLQSI